MSTQVVITLDNREHGNALKDALLDVLDATEGRKLLSKHLHLVEDLILRISEAVS